MSGAEDMGRYLVLKSGLEPFGQNPLAWLSELKHSLQSKPPMEWT